MNIVVTTLGIVTLSVLVTLGGIWGVVVVTAVTRWSWSYLLDKNECEEESDE